MNGEDFVHVQLTAAGCRAAGEGEIVIAGSSYHFTFKPGEAQRVTRMLDWERVLSRELAGEEPMFELAGEAKSDEGDNHAV